MEGGREAGAETHSTRSHGESRGGNKAPVNHYLMC